jgi:hypothetical protein
MKTRATITDAPISINARLLGKDNLATLKVFSLSTCLFIVGISLGLTSQTVRAETEMAHPSYRYIEPATKSNNTQEANPVSSEKPTSADKKQQLEPMANPADGKGVLPTFSQADVDGDHYITKAELKNYPYLLQVFDKVDAGEDGKLEQHEYQNLEMETKREAEVR